MIGHKDYDFFPPYDARVYRQNDEAVARQAVAIEFEETIPHSDGTHTYTSVKFPLYDSNDKLYAVCGILNDITERKVVETKLARYMRELERSNQELDDFAYIASHDLKEPLRGLNNHATFLMEDYGTKLGDEGLQRLKRLGFLATRMEQLVNDLLYFSRLGRTELAIQPTDPNIIVLEIEQLMETFLKERNVKILIPKPMPRVVCDKPRITEVFRNLITNAAKYNDKEERIIEVGYLDQNEGGPAGTDQGAFYVKDNGIGIDPEFHEEIFRIFKRLPGAGFEKESGTGAGLTFVKKIIERHGGHIWLASKPGQGSIFYFTIGRRQV